MASAFSMLSMISKARRAQQAKRAASTVSVTDETANGSSSSNTTISSSTTTLPTSSAATATTTTATANAIPVSASGSPTPSAATTLVNASSPSGSPTPSYVVPKDKDTSDTASIKSTKSTFRAKFRKGTLLSRMTSAAVPTISDVTATTANSKTNTASNTPERPGTPAAAAEPATAGTVISEEPSSIVKSGPEPPKTTVSTTATAGKGTPTIEPIEPVSAITLSSSPKLHALVDAKKPPRSSSISTSSAGDFSVVGNDEGKEKEKARSSVDGDWTDAGSRSSIRASIKRTQSIEPTTTIENGILQRSTSSSSRSPADEIRKLEEMNRSLQEETFAYKDRVKKLEEAKGALEEENLADKERLRKLEEAKAALEGKNVRLARELKEKEAKWVAERRAERERLEAENAGLVQAMKEKEARLVAEKVAERKTLEGESARLVQEMKEKEGRLAAEKMAERKTLEGENARLAQVMKAKEGQWVAEKESLLAAQEKEKSRLVQEAKQKEAIWMQEVKARDLALETAKAQFARELVAKEARWGEEREADRLAFVDEKAKLAQEMKAKSEEWSAIVAKLEEQKVALEAENTIVVEQMKKRMEEWDDERKLREEELELVERDNEALTKRISELEDAVKQMESSKAKLEEILAGSQKETEEANKVIITLKADVSSALADVKRLQGEIAAQQQREGSLRDAMTRLRKEKDADLAVRDSHIESLNSKLTQSQSQVEELRECAAGRNREKDRIIEDLRDKMAAYYQYVDETDRRNRLLCDQLKRQSMDVRFVKPAESKFLLKSSTEQMDSAVRLLNNFNSEVFQMAASFADSVDLDTHLEDGMADLERLMVKLAPMMSRELVQALRESYMDRDQEPNTLLLQVALQACLTHCAEKFVNSWYPFQWDHGDLLQIMYNRILESGKRDLADSWRATTKAMLRLTSESHPQLLAYLREHVYDVLAVIGRSKTQPAVDRLVKQYEEKLSIIARQTIRLHILYSDILFNDALCNLASYVAAPGSEFSSKRFEDNYPEGGDSQTDLLADNRVLCTAEMGLLLTSGNHALVKPKVVLATILNPDW